MKPAWRMASLLTVGGCNVLRGDAGLAPAAAVGLVEGEEVAAAAREGGVGVGGPLGIC